ncbi:MAG TPA: carbohydrate kinase [Thermotogota bacterium]|nr:carbohydrate kinase [Thermotogota bacterium]HPJ87510.1 carbohydrate kinase [Thermotogota bacterium]HPR94715.1 carbohydrate kinase [Thermotogota bacterium]
MRKILVLGESLIDFVSQEYSDSLETVNAFTRHAGGSPANIVSNLINFGIHPYFITRVGNDPFGRYLIHEFRTKSIDTTYVQIDDVHNTSMVFVSKSSGTPKFLPLRSAEQYIEFKDEFTEIIRGIEFLHISAWPISHEPVRKTVFRIIEESEAYQTKLCFDPNFREVLWERKDNAKEILTQILKKTWLCKPSDDDAFHIFGKDSYENYIYRFHEAGAVNVILTMGKDGALVSNGNRIKHLKSVAKEVVDSTGAGDGFWSGVYYSLLNKEDIFTAAETGGAVAAYRLKSIGSDEPLPPIEAIKDEFLS